MKFSATITLLTLSFIQNPWCSPPPPRPAPAPEVEPDWASFGPDICHKVPDDFSRWEFYRMSKAIEESDLPWLKQCHQESRRAGFHPFIEHEIISGAISKDGDVLPVLEQLFEDGAMAHPDLLWQTMFAQKGDAFKLLVANGTDPNARTSDSPYQAETVLNSAAILSDVDTIQAMLEAGADPTIRTAKSDNDGSPAVWLNAAGWAKDNNDPKVQVLLRKAVAGLERDRRQVEK